jgi:hypothetical protein
LRRRSGWEEREKDGETDAQGIVDELDAAGGGRLTKNVKEDRGTIATCPAEDASTRRREEGEANGVQRWGNNNRFFQPSREAPDVRAVYVMRFLVLHKETYGERMR